MKLIDYVINIDKNINTMKTIAKHYNIDVKDFILQNYCPSYFKCLNDTPYANPLQQYKKDKTDCLFRHIDNFNKCKTCWERKVLNGKS